MPRRQGSSRGHTTSVETQSESDDGSSHTGGSQDSQSTGTPTAVTLSAEQLSSPEIQASISGVLRHILSLQGRRRLIKLDEIRRLSLPVQHAKLARRLVREAAQQLESIFGLRLVELEKGGEYVLTNQLTCDVTGHVVSSAEEQKRRGLIMVLLSVIFMNDGVMSEAAMWSFLERLNLLGDGKYSSFGDIKKFVTVDLVRLRYIRLNSGPVVDDKPTHEFVWGEHAHAVLKPLDVLKFVCEVWGDDVQPSMWRSQYKRALDSNPS